MIVYVRFMVTEPVLNFSFEDIKIGGGDDKDEEE